MLLKSAFIALFSFYNVDTTMLKECENQADKTSGCVKGEYHSNGNLWIEVPYKNGKLNGMSKWYDEYGNPNTQANKTNKKPCEAYLTLNTQTLALNLKCNSYI